MLQWSDPVFTSVFAFQSGRCEENPSDYTATGFLSNGEVRYHPNNTYFYTNNAGSFVAELVEPGGYVDFDLRLYKWNGGGWEQVASSLCGDPVEKINYSGAHGYYFWSVYAFSGSGNYTFGFSAH